MARNHKKNDWDKNKKIPGLVGPEGPQGTSGGTGPQGPKGDKGDTGATGATGPQGPKGDKGDTGATGATGPAGPAGADGADGQGVPTGGSSGKILFKLSSTDFDTQWGDTKNSALNISLLTSVSTVSPITGEALRVSGSGSQTAIVMEGYSGPPIFQTYYARGTAASPTAPLFGENLFQFGANAYNGSTFTGLGVFRWLAEENWDTTHNGNYFVLQTIEPATTTRVNALEVHARWQRNPPANFSQLPSASSAGKGSRAFVQDSTTATFNAVVSGGGSNNVPVFSDGTNWRVG